MGGETRCSLLHIGRPLSITGMAFIPIIETKAGMSGEMWMFLSVTLMRNSFAPSSSVGCCRDHVTSHPPMLIYTGLDVLDGGS